MSYLVPVRRLPTQSRSRHFGGGLARTTWPETHYPRGILSLAVFTLELEMDYPSETSLCTVAPSPTDIPSPFFFFFFFWGGGCLERIISSSNCPSKLTGKVRRAVHSKLKVFHFQIKTYYLSDANRQKDNPSHTNNASLVWKRPFLL